MMSMSVFSKGSLRPIGQDVVPCSALAEGVPQVRVTLGNQGGTVSETCSQPCSEMQLWVQETGVGQ